MLNKMEMDENYMRRCFDLARLGRGYVAPNPEVGAVLVHEGRIIGEGFHQRYGHAHAEVNAVHSVAPEDRRLIDKSTLYVSLEPCCFHGKTPPCTSLITEHKIPRVVISCLDNTPEVAGKGVRILQEAGIEVSVGILEEEGKRLTRIRTVIATQNRPYVMLKFAQTRNGFFAPFDPSRKWISQPLTKRITHKWRAEVDAILIGTQTARIDNPLLTTRHYFGPSPLRLVLDRHLSLPEDLRLFTDDQPTVVITERVPKHRGTYRNPKLSFLELPFHDRLLIRILKYLHEQKIGVLMVEGGTQLIQSFLSHQLWDEARVIVGPISWKDGKAAPQVPARVFERHQLGLDELLIFHKS